MILEGRTVEAVALGSRGAFRLGMVQPSRLHSAERKLVGSNAGAASLSLRLPAHGKLPTHCDSGSPAGWLHNPGRTETWWHCTCRLISRAKRLNGRRKNGDYVRCALLLPDSLLAVTLFAPAIFRE